MTVLGVTDTSHTGPSYRPRGTPLSSASCKTQEPLDSGPMHRGGLPGNPPDGEGRGQDRAMRSGDGRLSLWRSTAGTDVSTGAASPRSKHSKVTGYSIKINVSYCFPQRHFHFHPVGIPKHVVKRIRSHVQDLAPNSLSNLTVPFVPP